jgi:hypothetical protein
VAAASFSSSIVEGSGFAIGEAIIFVVLVAIAAGVGMNRDGFLEHIGTWIAGLFRKGKGAETQWRFPWWTRLAAWLVVTGMSGFVAWVAIRAPIEREADSLPTSPATLSPGTIWNDGGKFAVVAPQSGPPPPVSDGFRKTYDYYKSDLGLPITAAADSDAAYEAQHQNAMALVFAPFGEIYILQNDKTFSSYPTTNWDRVNPAVDPKCLASIPEDKRPEGGVAWLWCQDPTFWQKQIGLREWSCSMSGKFHYQRFEHGTMMGVLVHATKPGGLGRIFILFDNGKDKGKWTTNFIPADPVPPCGTYEKQ